MSALERMRQQAVVLGPSIGDRLGEHNIDVGRELLRAPENVMESLRRATELRGPFEPRGSLQSWQETLYSSIATETALTAAAVGYLFPNYYGGPIPPLYLVQHRTLHLRIAGQLSAAATPGTFTAALKLRALADAASAGVTLATSAATTMTASATNVSWRAEFYMTCRSEGVSGTILATGIFECSGGIPTTGAMHLPASAPAVATVDTTITKYVTFTHSPSLATASIAGFQYTLSSLN
jgi:hypothetical protein